MKLQIFLPTRVLLETGAASVAATAPNGAFGLRPNHIDFVTALVPGLLGYRPAAGDAERFVAVDRGILVKQGDQVRVSVRNGVAEAPLEELAALVAEHFARLDEEERKVRTALARLEADFLRRFMQV